MQRMYGGKMTGIDCWKNATGPDPKPTIHAPNTSQKQQSGVETEFGVYVKTW